MDFYLGISLVRTQSTLTVLFLGRMGRKTLTQLCDFDTVKNYYLFTYL